MCPGFLDTESRGRPWRKGLLWVVRGSIETRSKTTLLRLWRRRVPEFNRNLMGASSMPRTVAGVFLRARPTGTSTPQRCGQATRSLGVPLDHG